MTRSRLPGPHDEALDLTVSSPDREHDLPVSWDGLPVTWAPWQPAPVVFVCPQPREPTRCSTCGSTVPPTTARGRTQSDLGSRLLVVTRCGGCQLDTVWDAWAHTHWTLDDADYGPDGSTPP